MIIINIGDGIGVSFFNEIDNFLYYDFNMLLTRNRHVDWKNMIRDRATVLMRFLKNNELIKLDPFDENGDIRSNLVIRKNDLTEDGRLFFDTARSKWEAYLDRGGDVNNTSHLEKGLKKIREAK